MIKLRGSTFKNYFLVRIRLYLLMGRLPAAKRILCLAILKIIMIMESFLGQCKIHYYSESKSLSISRNPKINTK